MLSRAPAQLPSEQGQSRPFSQVGLLDNYDWTVEIFDIDRTGRRLEATIRIDSIDVGDFLIAEGLARRWPDGDEWWCRLR